MNHGSTRFSPCGKDKVSHPTTPTTNRATKTTARTTAILVATLALLFVTATPAAAYRTISARWGFGKNTFTVCIHADANQGFNSDIRRNHLKQWINEWKGLSAADWSVEDNVPVVDSGCSGYDIEVIADNTFTNPARTDLTVLFGTNIIHAKIHLYRAAIDNDRFWWGLGAMDCEVGIGQGCLMDMRTVIKHEFGHALALAENQASPTPECIKGYGFTEEHLACDSAGEKIMYYRAGTDFLNQQSGNPHQGYRRNIKQDDIDGLVSIYGAP